VKYYPDGGEIPIDLTALREHEINRLGIGRKFQTPAVYEQLSVWQNLLISLDRPRGIWATLTYKVTSEDKERIEEILETVALKELRTTQAGYLSHGKKQGRSSGWRSVCCLRRTRSCCLSMNPQPA